MATATMAVKFAGTEDDSVEPIITKMRGEVVARTGDGLIAEFAKPAKALECARLITSREASPPHRIGIQIGEAKSGAAAQAVKLAGTAAAGCAAISREVMDAVRRIKGGYATSIGRQDFGAIGPLEVLHVFRPRREEMKGGHNRLLAPLLAALVSIVVLGGYALHQRPSLLQMAFGIHVAPPDRGPGAEAGTSGFQRPPRQ